MPKRDRETHTLPGRIVTPPPAPLRTGLSLLALAAAVIIVFYPLTQYFFAQDDFVLILESAFQGGDSLVDTLRPHPGQFRPLSKVIYFSAMYGMFGLNPLPYHAVSLLVYILNAILFFMLMRRFRVSYASALLTTFLFALSTSFINVVAWISCIQQLLGQCFGLLMMNLGVRGIESRSWRLSLLATASYALSLMSIEQTAGLPIVLALYAFTSSPDRETGRRLRHSVSAAMAPLAAMAVYGFFMLVWKRLPGAGPYTLHAGTNVIDNFLVYSDWAYAFSIQIPFLINNVKTGLTTSHLVVLAVVIYNCARGRKNAVIIGCAYYLLTLLPVLPFKSHTFFTHTYIPSFGLLLLLGWVIDDFCRFLSTRSVKSASICAAVFVALISAVSFIQTQKNLHTPIRDDYPLPRNYVLRRAIIARTAYQDIVSRKADLPAGGKFFMVFMGEKSWPSDNVVAALGEGSAIKLFFNDPLLQVFSHVKGDTLEAFTQQDSQILFYDPLGHFYTDQEVAEKGKAIGEVIP